MVREVENIDTYRAQLKAYLLSIVPETDEDELSELVKHFTIEKFEKKQIILNSGESSGYVHFICEGLVRIFYHKEDKEITNWLVNENMIFTGIYSALSGNVNQSIYQAIENTITLKIKQNELESFCNQYHSIEHLSRKMVELYYGKFMIKTFNVLFLSAEERYNLFLKEHYNLYGRLPLRVLSTYLGITQETLSRLRAKR